LQNKTAQQFERLQQIHNKLYNESHYRSEACNESTSWHVKTFVQLIVQQIHKSRN